MKKYLLLLGLLFFGSAGHAQVNQTQICLPTSSGCIPVNNSTPFPISTNVPAAVQTTNASQIIATGGTFQQALAANPSRKALTVINNNTNGHNCYLYIGGGPANTSNSILLPPNGQYFRNSGYIPQDVIQVTCSGAADTVYVDYE
jgi:hypothetical protein